MNGGLIRELDRLKEIKRTEFELYIEVLRALPDAIFVVDESGVIVLMNSQAEIISGWHRTQLVGKTIETLIPSDRRAQHQENRQAYQQSPRLRPMGDSMELQLLQKNGSLLHVVIMLAPVVTTAGVFTVATVRRA